MRAADMDRHNLFLTLPAASVIAAGLSSRLQDIRAILTPFVDQGGVVALYEQSLKITGRVYPWLAAPEEASRSGMDLEGLKLLVARQDDAVAAAGAAFLLKSFHEQLACLVGSAVAKHLIGASPVIPDAH